MLGFGHWDPGWVVARGLVTGQGPAPVCQVHCSWAGFSSPAGTGTSFPRDPRPLVLSVTACSVLSPLRQRRLSPPAALSAGQHSQAAAPHLPHVALLQLRPDEERGRLLPARVQLPLRQLLVDGAELRHCPLGGAAALLLEAPLQRAGLQQAQVLTAPAAPGPSCISPAAGRAPGSCAGGEAELTQPYLKSPLNKMNETPLVSVQRFVLCLPAFRQCLNLPFFGDKPNKKRLLTRLLW